MAKRDPGRKRRQRTIDGLLAASTLCEDGDAELLELGRQFDALAAGWRGGEDASVTMQPILRSISEKVAHTSAGTQVKLRVAAWCLNGDAPGEESDVDECDPTIAWSIVRDLLLQYGLDPAEAP